MLEGGWGVKNCQNCICLFMNTPQRVFLLKQPTRNDSQFHILTASKKKQLQLRKNSSLEKSVVKEKTAASQKKEQLRKKSSLLIFRCDVCHDVLVEEFQDQRDAVGKHQMLRHKLELVHVVDLKKIVLHNMGSNTEHFNTKCFKIWYQNGSIFEGRFFRK